MDKIDTNIDNFLKAQLLEKGKSKNEYNHGVSAALGFLLFGCILLSIWASK